MLGKRIINTKVAGGGGGCTDIVDNYDPFDGNGVALYQLNGNANDSSPNAYNGTWSGTETYGTGVFGQAGVFNGSSYINLGNVLNTTFSNNFSISTWVNFDAPGAIIQKGPNVPNGQFVRLYTRSSTPRIQFGFSFDAGNQSSLMTTNSFDPTGKGWVHILGTIDYSDSASGVKLYVNGEFVESKGLSGSAPTFTMTSNLEIGNNNDTYYANGSIDQVRIFNTALTPLEVEALYTEELCICDGTVDTLDILGDGSCIATYQLDGNANDLSGNYSGTPTDVSYDIGYFDRAGVFNGTSSSIEVPSGLRKNNDFTASIWFNTNSTTDGQAPINFRNGKKFAVSLNNSNVGNGSIRVNAGNNTAVDSAVGIFTTNTWYNLVVVQSSVSGVTVYLNNSVVASNSGATGDLVTVTGLDCIGSYDGTLSFFDGSIDQFRYFNKALNSSEVTTLYNETACTKPSGSLEVGDFVEGGVVYWVDPSDDTKGLVVSINDLGFIRFCVDSLKDNIPQTSESLGQSKNSTDTIVGVIGTSASNAAGLCRSYDDNTWDLPTRGDMQQMYANKDLLNSKFSSLGGNSFKGASSQWYWTSGFFSQYESAREYRFSNGASELGTVITLNYVRACKQVGNW